MKIRSAVKTAFAGILLLFALGATADGGGSSYVASLPDSLVDLVEKEQFTEAVPALTKFVRKERNNADAWNLLGYSQRKTGMLKKSLKSYRKALSLDPGHIGAHEYIGELYLMMDKPDKARKHLKRLKRYCGDCEQVQKLADAIEKHAG